MILQKIKALSAAYKQEFIDIRRYIHSKPELSYVEFETSKYIQAKLSEWEIPFVVMATTGVVGLIKSKNADERIVALRADMDALPITEKLPLAFASKTTTNYNGKESGVMHACGHDAHTAILMGVAEIFAGMRKELRGTVKFIFQPAEEGAPEGEENGAKLMIKEGVMENPKVDVIFGLHVSAETNVGQISYKPAGFMASASDMKIVIFGKGAHGASPWMGVDPIVTSAQIVNNLQTIISRNLKLIDNPAIVTIGAINGGNRSNIIPEKVEMLGTVRTFTADDEKMIFERIRTIVTKTAESNGAIAEVILPYTFSYPVTFNDIALVQKMLPTLERTTGKGKTVLVSAITGAEDFSFFQQKVPGFFFQLGSKPLNAKATSHHTADFFLDESSFKLGVNAFTNLVLDYMDMNKNK